MLLINNEEIAPNYIFSDMVNIGDIVFIENGIITYTFRVTHIGMESVCDDCPNYLSVTCPYSSCGIQYEEIK